MCATPINNDDKKTREAAQTTLKPENPPALSLKLTKGQNNIREPKNTLSLRSRLTAAHTCAQRIRSVIIYCAVKLDVPKEADSLGPTLQQQVSRIFFGRKFGAISEEVLEPVISMRYSQ